MTGIAQGFSESQRRSQQQTIYKNELITIEKELIQHKQRVYGNLRSQQCHQHVNHNAKASGREVGQTLNINQGLGQKIKKMLTL
jgi:hypothetical protein